MRVLTGTRKKKLTPTLRSRYNNPSFESPKRGFPSSVVQESRPVAVAKNICFVTGQ